MNSRNAIAATFWIIAMLTSCAGGEDGAQPGETSEPNRSLTAEEYHEKVHGAWLGAAIAGALGMSVEGMHKDDLKIYLTELGQWPDDWERTHVQIDELARRTVAVGTMMTAAKSAGLVEIVSR